MAQIAAWNDSLTAAPFDYDADYFETLPSELVRMAAPDTLSDEELFFWFGFWHDRDVLAYYGDPKWNVGMQEVPGESDFTVTSEFKRLSRDEAAATGASRRCVIFPHRLSNPVLPEGETRNIVVDENFLLLYDPAFEPGQTYTFEVLCD